MAFSGTQNVANRRGLDLKVYEYTDGTVASTAEPVVTIDYCNVSAVSLTGDRVWATGGQEHANKIAFDESYNGTLTVSTQIVPLDLLRLMGGGEFTSGTTDVIFKNDSTVLPQYYTIVANTVWQDAEGIVDTETITFHKVSPQRAFNLSYTGEGDPQSVDCVFDMIQDDSKKVMTISRAQQTTPESGGGGGGGEEDPEGT